MGPINPLFNEKLLKKMEASFDSTNLMTIRGSINKTLILLGLVFLAAMITYRIAGDIINIAELCFWIFGGAIGGFVFALITIFKVEWSPVTTPIYAVLEGLSLGSFSVVLDTEYPGIVIRAISLTFGVLFVMLVIYKTGIIKVTNKFAMGVTMAIGAVAEVYLISFVLRFFGVAIPYLHDSGPIGIGISLVICGIAAFSFLLDFYFIEKVSKCGAPKYMEWYGAFGLIVTIVWLYLEILRLLSMFRK